MQAALEQARRGIGLTSPNPPVGAVIVMNDKVIARQRKVNSFIKMVLYKLR